MRSQQYFIAVLALFLLTAPSIAEDWLRFRGPQGLGVSDSSVPTEWSDTKNLKWKTALPGAGSSSPIVVGDKVLLTCYSGYGVPGEGRGRATDLKRHLVCVNRRDGKILWTKTVDASDAEDNYGGYLREHGYASNTPVSDGKIVVAFFSKAGVRAYDLEGKELWKASVGTESDSRRWGSASSTILYKDLAIVVAAGESKTIYAFDKMTGKQKWKAPAGSLDLTFGSPLVVTPKEGDPELVISVPGEVWGMNPETGKLKWYCVVETSGNVSPSVIAKDGIIYAGGGYRTRGLVAIRAGGKDDVSRTHVEWQVRTAPYVATPLLHEGHLYWIGDDGRAYCLSAKDGKEVYKERMPVRGGGGSRPFYASSVLAKDKIIVPSRYSGVFVFEAKPKFEKPINNTFSDKSMMNGTPAISDGQLFLRSDKYLYCVAEK